MHAVDRDADLRAARVDSVFDSGALEFASHSSATPAGAMTASSAGADSSALIRGRVFREVDVRLSARTAGRSNEIAGAAYRALFEAAVFDRDARTAQTSPRRGCAPITDARSLYRPGT